MHEFVSANSEPLQKWWTVKLINKIKKPSWVKWVHISQGESHCETCLRLDGCWFSEDNTPKIPQHPHCHCNLEPIDFELVEEKAVSHCDYSKFDPYLFDPEDFYQHGKQKMFESWGYTIEDSMWLKKECEKQALEKYKKGDYKLGKLNEHGQRISIRITIPRKNNNDFVSFITGWNVHPNGKITLNTPLGGK